MSFHVPCHGNPLLCTDSYKVTHDKQYPPGTTKVFSYFECRGGVYKDVTFFGLQHLLKDWMVGKVVTEERIAHAKEYLDKHFGSEVFPEERWRYILKNHDGKLPLLIKAVPEGTTLPYKNVLFTVENTDPEAFWLVTWFETLLVQTWYPITVCTHSRYQKVEIKKYLAATAESCDGLPFKLHDFGFRGASSAASAAIGGCAHLVNFMGTDTLAALVAAREVYGLPDDQVAGFSIPASEHSTITSWGPENETEAFKNMLTSFPTGLVACVSDSFNIWDACRDLWGTKLKDLVAARDGTLVVRPDSGHPPEVVIKCLEILGAQFGTTKNSKGFRELPPYIRLIQGDGVDLAQLKNILKHMYAFGWSTDMVAFGSGGGLLQKLNRDTLKCAYKCSWVEVTVDGKTVSRDVSKNPITDRGKKSKRGRLTLECNDGVWTTVENGDPARDQMKPVFQNGDLLIDYKYADIRARADVGDVEPVEPFVSSEEWVRDFDAWAKENLGDKAPPSKAGLYAPKPGPSIDATLDSLKDAVKADLSKDEVVAALTALNNLNAQLLEVAKTKIPPVEEALLKAQPES
eukprot:m.67855 g.67855  ORF g.67855 m.67855 type:complete len:573 (+) comp8473_c0_seq1:64-1782(+)